MTFHLKVDLVIYLAVLVSVAAALDTAYSIKEVKFIGGESGGDGGALDSRWVPATAFKARAPIDSGWHVGPNPTGPNQATSLPVIIWYDFKTRHFIPAEVSLQPAQPDADALQGAPSMWQLVGSNDIQCNEDSNWTVVCEDLSDKKWRSIHEVRYCRVKPEMEQSFRCFGIRILNNLRTTGWASLRNVRLWERA